jgi:hypothetical protein
VDEIFMHPEKTFTWYNFEQRQKELNIIRYEALEKIGPGLHPAIRKVFEPV